MSRKKISSSVGTMGQKSTSVERGPSDKHCYICKSTEDSLLQCISCGRYCDKVCAWLEDYDVSSVDVPIDWQCPDCKTGTQLSPDMDVDTSSVMSFDSVVKSRSVTKFSTPPPPPLTPAKASDKALKKSELTPKAISKRQLSTPKHPSPPQVVIKSQKKKSESGSPSKRQKKSSKPSPLVETEPKNSSASSQTNHQDSATQTEHPSEMKLPSSKHQPDELQSALHTIQTHLDHLHVLRTRNEELTEEVKALKERANTGEETSWELKEYNENLEEQVKELKSERDELHEKLRKIRRLSGIDMLGIDV